MKATVSIVTVTALFLGVTGCGTSSSESSDAMEMTNASFDGSKYLLAEEPDGAVGVIEARESAKDGEPVVIVGRIGGAENPWIEGRAAFMLLDASKVIVAAGEDTSEKELCTEDCCAVERAGCTTLVKIMDASGKVVTADARKLLGLTTEDMVVVRGKAKKDERDNFTVLADAVHIRR
jgi:hypothetical protein